MKYDQTTPAPVEVTALKPCPFCGTVPNCDWRSASPIEGPDEGYWDITCCRAFAHEDTEAEAIAAWNTRHSAPADEVEPVLRWEGNGADRGSLFVRKAEAARVIRSPLSKEWHWKALCGAQDGVCGTLTEARTAAEQAVRDWLKRAGVV